MRRLQQACFGSVAVLAMQLAAALLLWLVARIFPAVFLQNPPTGLQTGLSGLLLMIFYALLIYAFLCWRERQRETDN
ncbi:MAG TPA: hypothetical protein VGC89_10085 [Pyrinomonadaceae bacterium]|jgi:hypothetical protein